MSVESFNFHGRYMLIGNAKVDFDGLFIEGSTGLHSVEPKVMALLTVLLEKAPNVVAREELINKVWGVEYGGDERLTRAISLLRKAFGDMRGQYNYIETISKRGYRLIAEVSDTQEIVIARAHHSQDRLKFEVPQDTKDKGLSGIQAVEMQSSDLPRFQKTVSPIAGLKLGLAALALMALITIGIITLKPHEYISVQAQMAQGMDHIENFTTKDAIEDAQDIFGNILADNPDHAAARAGLALALMREYTHLESDPDVLRRAKANAQAAYRIDDHLALANIAIGWGEEFSRNYNRAHGFYDRADILDPNNKFTFEGRARTYNKQGKMDKTEEILDAAIHHYPDYTLFHLFKGELFSSLGDFANAQVSFTKAIALSKDNSVAYSQLAHVLYMRGKASEAIKTIQEGLIINETAQLYNNLGTYLFFQGQYEMSAEAFEKTLKFEGNSHNHLYWANLGDAYRQVKGQEDKVNQAYMRAIQLLKIELDKQPTHSDLNSRAALYYAKLGKFDRAQAALDNFISQDKLNPVKLYRALVAFEIMADRPKAIEMLSLTIEAGYPLAEIMNDPELKNLRQDPAYHQLLSNKGTPL